MKNAIGARNGLQIDHLLDQEELPGYWFYLM